MSADAQTLGERLKAERERRGLSAQKVADEMHLDAWVIDALETGDYERIGPSVYAKGHLKKYASILGLPPADIAPGYAGAAPAAQASNPPPFPGMRMRSKAAPPAEGPWPQVGAVALVVLAVGAIAWWRPWQQRTPAPHPVAQAPAARSAPAEEGTAAPAAAGANSEAVSAENAPAAPPSLEPPSAAPAAPATEQSPPSLAAAPAAEAPSVPGAGRARLRLSFTSDSWVEVRDATGRRIFSGNGRANSVQAVSGSAPLSVYLGFASGVQLELNDRVVAIGPQFFSGDVARFEAGADGVLRRETRSAPAQGAQARATSPRG